MGTTKEQDGKRIVREALSSEATAWQWLGERRRETLDEGRVVLRSAVTRSSRGNRHHAEVVSVTAAWVVARKRERDVER